MMRARHDPHRSTALELSRLFDPARLSGYPALFQLHRIRHDAHLGRSDRCQDRSAIETERHGGGGDWYLETEGVRSGAGNVIGDLAVGQLDRRLAFDGDGFGELDAQRITFAPNACDPRRGGAFRVPLAGEGPCGGDL